MLIDKKSPIPVYFQLKNIILKKIESGEYRIGSPIPSERDLCEAFSISRMTVRQALNQLVNEGVLYREKGKGTFVSKPKIEERNLMSFSDIVKQKGLVPSSRILRFEKCNADREIKEMLGLKDEDMVYELKRLRLANNVPIGIEETYIPERLCPGLEKYDLTDSLYKIIRNEYSYDISYVDNVIESSKPTKEEKKLLNIRNNIPVLKTTSINYITQNMKFIFERAVYRSDEYKYSVRVYVSGFMD